MKQVTAVLILIVLLPGMACRRISLDPISLDTPGVMKSEPQVRGSRAMTPAAQTLEPPVHSVFLPMVTKDICYTDTTRLELSVDPVAVRVRDTVTVTVTLTNTGCAPVGLPKYTLTVTADPPGSVLSPAEPEPVFHSLGVGPQGGVDTVDFILQATGPGEATLLAVVSFEVHLGYPGPAYWGGNASEPLKVTVLP